MCGIFGVQFADSTSEPDEQTLAESIAALMHRGPDATGRYIAPGIGLGHTRLALVDLDDRSNQPIWDATGRYCLVFNGEIYNFKALRTKLEAVGVQFRTESDTEVLLLALIHDPSRETLRSLVGMFAFAFYDREEKSLLLARDRFGMKPLHYPTPSGRFLFASEIKALQPWMRLEPDRFTVAAYLLGHGGPMRGPGFFAGVATLAPGHLLRVSPGTEPRIEPYFELTDFLDAEETARFDAMSPGQVVDHFDALLSDSVALHMFADARIGAFCSGGVDSSLLIAMAARQDREVALFHANVKGRWSEQHAAIDLAKHLGLELEIVDAVDQDFVDLIPAVMRQYETPFTYHPNCAPMMMVSELARQNGVKGLLSGEGSDECFLGYPWLGRKRLTDAWDQTRSGIGLLVRKIPGIGPILLPDTAGNLTPVCDLLSRNEMSDDSTQVSLAVARLASGKPDPTTGWTLDYMHHHLRTLLHRNDTMGMTHSIEARFPFLDHSLVSAAINLPGKYKLRVSPFVFEKAHPFMRDKWVIREVARRYMPPGLSQRIKIGFWTTVFKRMKVDPEFYRNSPLAELFGIGTRQLGDFMSDTNQDLQMRLLHTDIWMRICLHGETDEESVTRLRDHVSIGAE